MVCPGRFCCRWFSACARGRSLEWLHRPMLQNVKKALANTEPSTHGMFETCRRAVTMSVHRDRAEVVGTRSNRRD
jgi:glycine cleavage system protein P-like pyridoxal-binding family